MQDLIQIYKKILEDKKFSRGEKQAVNAVLRESGLNQKQLARLRNELFHLVRSDMKSTARERLALLDWLFSAFKTTLRETASPLRVQSFFSPGEDCLNAIQRALLHMRGGADICVFTITDNRISNLIRQAHRQGKKIRIITDDEKAGDPGSDIDMLAREGVAVRVDNSPHHMHHKFAVIDKIRLLTGSYNWTRSAASDNCENLLVLEGEGVAAPYLETFERLWSQCEPYV